MKNKLYTFFCLCLLANIQLQAQRHENIIKLGLVEPFYSSLGVAYERFIPETTISIQAYGSITQRNVQIWESLKPTLKGFSGEIQGRYYYAPKNWNTVSGIYNGIFFKYGETKITMTDAEAHQEVPARREGLQAPAHRPAGPHLQRPPQEAAGLEAKTLFPGLNGGLSSR